MFDIIGDIHGHASALEALLRKLGYREDGHEVWRHPERQVIFVGDFVDRGPEQEATLDLVRRMCDAGTAEAVMGNHEYNAICFATEDPDEPGAHLRARSPKNVAQHRAFLDAIPADSAKHREWIDWFRTLPLWIERDGLRVVHACWHPEEQRAIAPWLDDDGRLGDEGFVATSRRGTPAHAALETLLKGLEVPLPEGASFRDKDDNVRHEVRVRWWQQRATYRDGTLVQEEARAGLPDAPLPAEAQLGYHGDVPVFVGHYWLRGIPTPLAPKVACVDYSIAGRAHAGVSAGKLCAYRWSGERELRDDAFEWVEGTTR